MKKTIITIVIILILFILGLSIYKYKVYDKNENKKQKFETIELKNHMEDYTVTKEDIDYAKSLVLEENKLSIEYNYFHEEKSITGTVYIAEDKHLYISDTTNLSQPKVYKVSTGKFKSLYVKDYEYDGIYVYLITETNELAFLQLTGNDITTAKVYRFETKERYTNFIALNFNADMYGTPQSLFLLTKDGEIKDFTSGFSYSANIFSIFGKLYTFDDGILTNVYGDMITDKNGNSYKIKYAFMTYDDNNFTEKYSIILITENNKLLYIGENQEQVHEFDKKVKSIDFTREYTYEKNKLKIIFEDDYKVELTASCTMYYCPSK